MDIYERFYTVRSIDKEIYLNISFLCNFFSLKVNYNNIFFDFLKFNFDINIISKRFKNIKKTINFKQIKFKIL